jgi:hypothetical protein
MKQINPKGYGGKVLYLDYDGLGVRARGEWYRQTIPFRRFVPLRY